MDAQFLHAARWPRRIAGAAGLDALLLTSVANARHANASACNRKCRYLALALVRPRDQLQDTYGMHNAIRAALDRGALQPEAPVLPVPTVLPWITPSLLTPLTMVVMSAYPQVSICSASCMSLKAVTSGPLAPVMSSAAGGAMERQKERSQNPGAREAEQQAVSAAVCLA